MSREFSANTAAIKDAAPRQIMNTYYRSFGVSQSYDWLQERMLVLAGSKYNTIYDTCTIEGAIETIAPKIDKLVLPGNHVEASEEKIRYQFSTMWRYFAGALIYVSSENEPGRIGYTSLLSDSLRMQFGQDIGYMRTERYDADADKEVPFYGRPVGDTNRDPRQSYVRDYILGGISVKDSILDGLHTEMNELLIGAQPPRQGAQADMEEIYTTYLPELVRAWQAHHPGQQFFDPATYPGTQLAAAYQDI